MLLQGKVVKLNKIYKQWAVNRPTVDRPLGQSVAKGVVNLSQKGRSIDRIQKIITKETIQKKVCSPKVLQSAEEYLAEMKVDPGYSHVDFPWELTKMRTWLKDHLGRKFTKAFARNWINKIEPPLKDDKTQEKPKSQEDLLWEK